MLMRLNEAFYKYIYEHKDDNTNVLRLQQKESEEFDVLFAIDQIEARKKIKNKLPHWHQNISICYFYGTSFFRRNRYLQIRIIIG